LAKNDEKELLYQSVKFEIYPDESKIRVLTRVSNILVLVWNSALGERRARFELYIAPLYEELKKFPRKSAESNALRQKIREGYKEHIPTFFDQLKKLLTPMRKEDPALLGSVPRAYQEETLNTLNGSFVSFMTLRRNNDMDAKPPKGRAEDRFHEISGRSGFKIDGSEFVLSTKEQKLRFPIPNYQLEKLKEAKQIKKFTLYQSRDRRFWISIAYEIELPDQRPFNPEEVIYIAFGASSIGVISPEGEKVIDFWRPDKHWKPKIKEVENRMRSCKKGSRAWKKRAAARRKMYAMTQRQQKLNHREIVASLLRLGFHFVVTEYTVRSKPGKLADGSNPKRGGAPQGFNWSAQNTGSFGEFILWLKQKVKEQGGTVQTFRLVLGQSERPEKRGRDNKIEMVRLLREKYLESQTIVV